MSEPQPYDDVRVVSTFDEWANWAQNARHSFTVHADGDFGDQICDRLEAPRTSIIRAHIAWDIRYARHVLNFECWYDRIRCKDAAFAFNGPEDLEDIRAWLEGCE